MSLLYLCPYLWGDWTRQATGQCFLWFSFCCQCSSRNFQFQNPHFPIIKVQPFLPVQAPLAPKGFLVLHRSKSFLSTSHLSTKTLDFCLSLASHVGSTVLHGMQSLDPQLPAWHPNLGIFHYLHQSYKSPDSISISFSCCHLENSLTERTNMSCPHQQILVSQAPPGCCLS